MSHGLSQSLKIFISFFIALLIDIYPLPASLVWFRPELVCLLLIFWVLRFPHQIGMGMAWCVGFVQDIISGGVWGGNALALAIVAYICQMSYQRLRSYSLSQQTLWVFVFVGIYQLFFNWIQGMSGYSAPVHLMLISTGISAACWPPLVIIMSRIRRRRLT